MTIYFLWTSQIWINLIHIMNQSIGHYSLQTTGSEQKGVSMQVLFWRFPAESGVTQEPSLSSDKPESISCSQIVTEDPEAVRYKMRLLPVVVTMLLTAAVAYYVYIPLPDAIQEPWKLMMLDALSRTAMHLVRERGDVYLRVNLLVLCGLLWVGCIRNRCTQQVCDSNYDDMI